MGTVYYTVIKVYSCKKKKVTIKNRIIKVAIKKIIIKITPKKRKIKKESFYKTNV